MSKPRKKPNLRKVLFQKLGRTWYVFAETDQEEEIICTAIPEGIDPRVDSFELYEIIEEHFNQTGNCPLMAA